MRGGKREGAGRPKKAVTKVSVNINLPADVAALLKSTPGSQGVLIEEACRGWYGWTKIQENKI